jgi:hypothetical protein
MSPPQTIELPQAVSRLPADAVQVHQKGLSDGQS